MYGKITEIGLACCLLDLTSSPTLLAEYHTFFDATSFNVVCQQTKNHAFVGIKLHIAKEKLRLFIETRFEAYKVWCRKRNIDVISGLEAAINLESPQAKIIFDLLQRTNTSNWNECWWHYAKVFTKTANNFIVNSVDDADPLVFFQIITACNLFPRRLVCKAFAVIRVRNVYSHAAVFQTNATDFSKVLQIIDDFIAHLIH